MKASIAEVRRKEISNILKRDGNIHTEDIAKKFHVTTETIRKDIKVLQEQGLAVKCHGGAMAVGECVINRLSKRAVENSEVKKRIAEKAVELVHDQAILYIGPGSTCLCIAQLLASFADLTIFTSSLPAAEALADSRNRVYVLGGRLNGSTMSVHGMWSNDVIGSFAPNIAFLGSSGASGYPGPTCGNFEETETTKKILSTSSKVIVACDSSKFSWAGLVSYSQWEKVDVLVTDSNLSQEDWERLRQKTNVLLVDGQKCVSGDEIPAEEAEEQTENRTID